MSRARLRPLREKLGKALTNSSLIWLRKPALDCIVELDRLSLSAEARRAVDVRRVCARAEVLLHLLCEWSDGTR
jgi:hypothetical protein